MSEHRIDPGWRDRTAYALLLLMVCWMPWPWASVGELSQAVMLAITGLSLLLSLASAEIPWPRSRAFRTAVIGWLLWLAWLLLSILPLPAELIQVLSPSIAKLHASLAELGAEPSWTLSAQPEASRRHLLVSSGLFGLYLLAARSVRDDRRRLWLLAALAASAGVQALYGLGMTLTGTEIGFFAKKIYGIGWATGSFVNRNHFAHLLILGAAAALGLLLSQRRERVTSGGWRGSLLRVFAWLMSPAAVWRVLLLVLLVAVVLSQSRMGNLVLTVVLVLAVLLWVLLHDRVRLATALLLLGSFAIADLWIVERYYGLQKVVDRLEDTELAGEQRTVALRDIAPLVGPYLVTGSGGGSFQSLFLGVQSTELRGFYDHAHNEYAEWLIEHGAFGLVWLLAMGLLHAVHSLRLLRGRRSRGARALALAGIGALLAAALHSTADFVLHIPALRAWLAVLMGAVVATGLPVRPSSRGSAVMRHNDDDDTVPSSPSR